MLVEHDDDMLREHSLICGLLRGEPGGSPPYPFYASLDDSCFGARALEL
jgi:hypothetical protein